MDCSPPGSSVHGDSPGKNTGVGCHALLQGILPTQRSNPGLPCCRQILYRLSYQGNLNGYPASKYSIILWYSMILWWLEQYIQFYKFVIDLWTWLEGEFIQAFRCNSPCGISPRSWGTEPGSWQGQGKIWQMEKLVPGGMARTLQSRRVQRKAGPRGQPSWRN